MEEGQEHVCVVITHAVAHCMSAVACGECGMIEYTLKRNVAACVVIIISVVMNVAMRSVVRV